MRRNTAFSARRGDSCRFVPAEIHAADAGEKTLSVVLSNDGTDFIAEAVLVSNGRENSYSCRTPFLNDDSIIEKRFSKRCIKIAVFRAMRKAYPDAHLRGAL